MRVHQCAACRDVSPTNLLCLGPGRRILYGRGLFFGHFHRAVARSSRGTSIIPLACELILPSNRPHRRDLAPMPLRVGAFCWSMPAWMLCYPSSVGLGASRLGREGEGLAPLCRRLRPLNDAGKPIDISLGRQGKAVGLAPILAGGFAV